MAPSESAGGAGFTRPTLQSTIETQPTIHGLPVQCDLERRAFRDHRGPLQHQPHLTAVLSDRGLNRFARGRYRRGGGGGVGRQGEDQLLDLQPPVTHFDPLGLLVAADAAARTVPSPRAP